MFLTADAGGRGQLDPASALLERIRAERAEREKQPKTRKVAKRRAVKEPA
jgi:hypothetical protein